MIQSLLVNDVDEVGHYVPLSLGGNIIEISSVYAYDTDSSITQISSVIVFNLKRHGAPLTLIEQSKAIWITPMVEEEITGRL